MMLRTLVIETATPACSVALIEGDRVIAARHEIVGRGHAERLVPMVAELPEGGRAAAVLVDVGPGSFTGIRVGLAAARGLGLGWGVPVTGFSSTALLAAQVLDAHPDWPSVAAVLEGGHGEVFVQAFDRALTPLAELRSLTPAAALEMLAGRAAAGSGVARLRTLAPDVRGDDALPEAARAVLLPATLTGLAPRPIYGRAPDAVPQAERATR